MWYIWCLSLLLQSMILHMPRYKQEMNLKSISHSLSTMRDSIWRIKFTRMIIMAYLNVWRIWIRIAWQQLNEIIMNQIWEAKHSSIWRIVQTATTQSTISALANQSASTPDWKWWARPKMCTSISTEKRYLTARDPSWIWVIVHQEYQREKQTNTKSSRQSNKRKGTIKLSTSIQIMTATVKKTCWWLWLKINRLMRTSRSWQTSRVRITQISMATHEQTRRTRHQMTLKWSLTISLQRNRRSSHHLFKIQRSTTTALKEWLKQWSRTHNFRFSRSMKKRAWGPAWRASRKRASGLVWTRLRIKARLWWWRRVMRLIGVRVLRLWVMKE